MINKPIKCISGENGKPFSVYSTYNKDGQVENFYYANINSLINVMPSTDIESFIYFLNILGEFKDNLLYLGSKGTITKYSSTNEKIGNFFIDQFTLRLRIDDFSFTYNNVLLKLISRNSFSVFIKKTFPCDLEYPTHNIAEIISEFESIIFYPEIGFFKIYSLGLKGKLIPYTRYFVDENIAVPIVLSDSSFTINIAFLNN